jgi:hypothetical protein
MSNSDDMLNLKISPDLLLSLATAPLLVGLLTSKAFAELIQDVGQASEEIFRGDRLPVLDFSTAANQTNTID